MAVSNTKVNRFKLVAAIEIGTPFSTYAFSTVNGFQKDPLDIQQIKTWYSDSKRKGITKTSTCLLLDQKLRFVSFGNDAQEEYAQLKHTKKNTEYLFFRHFNLQLYESKEPFKKLQLNDLDGNGKTSAKRVYTMAIIALKNELLQQFETDERLSNEADILWILSTPAAFPEDSISFMKECAKQVLRKMNLK
ncbi:heat shock 70 kDa protein 12B-like [Mytilus edulis]|uniref:heat shock 70 kDa protein 12B-like n=1 Tax=Mytilus edulis TaxID=6550 RepID=UPI0039F0DB4A